MIIAFDAKRAFCNNTGLGNYSRMIIGGIASLHPEDEIVLYTPKREGQYESYFVDYKNIVVVSPKGVWRLVPSLWRTFGIGIRRKQSPHVFHGLSHELPLFLPLGVKKVVTMHDMIVWRHPEYFPLFDRLIYKLKQRHAARCADVVIAISRQTADDVRRWLEVPESKIRIVYQSCDRQFYESPILNSQFSILNSKYGLPERYIICVGTIERRKNQVAVVRAMAQLPADVHLVMLGRATEYYAEVQAAARDLHVESRVHVIHKADFADFPYLYRMAIASAYMSLFEGWGIPVLESMCCGTPVVTSNCSSMPEVGGDAALYADPNNVADIAEKLNKVISDQYLRDMMKEKGLSQAERFSQQAISAEMFKVY